ncbi:MAG TPA: CRISPR-associated helicase Cas3', partial [Paracoccaceae bacterium]|nr:CRISPR-associated helicase Cas3' [Paracoccaceae bacterium]
MLDVAAVAEVLIRPWGFSSDLHDAVILLTALHDLGKISNSFRAMLTEGTRQGRRHWEMTEVLLHRHDELVKDLLGGNPVWRRRLYASVAGHHGRPPTLESLDDFRLDREIGEEAIHDAAIVISAFAELWPDASLDRVGRENGWALNWWLPGFITVADWIGSNTGWFPPCLPGLSLPAYQEQARARAARAVVEAGMHAPRLSEAHLFDFDLRPMQQACADQPIPNGPMLAVIEDETGAGKTEAALILAQRMMLADKGRGIYFALPTTATADAMFRRARNIVRRLFDGPPSLTLAHGRAALSGDFRALHAGRQDRPDDEAVCSDWLADNRRKALLATVGVGTIDQALLSVLPTRFATLRHYGLASKILIVDEVHEMGAPYMATELAQLLRAQRMAGGSAILLTATLPLEQRQMLLDAWGAEDDGDTAYPALTIANGESRRDLPQIEAPRGPVMVGRLPGSDEAVALLVEQAGRGAACLWVRNAVDDAIAGVDALRAAGVQADLLHARYLLADRLRHEAALLGVFGKEGAGREGRVLVATQVVESSLDLDFDVMVSDLAPMAALIQRAGRLWRHMDLHPADRRPTPGPILHVVSPDPALVEDDQWLHRVLDRGAWVYPLDLQWRTADMLFRIGRIAAPSGLRALIEAVHGESAAAVPEPLQQAEDERLGMGFAEANQARRNLIDLARGYRGNAAAPDTDYPTRLGQKQRTLLLVSDMNGRLRPIAGRDDPEGWQLSEVQVSESRLKGLDLPDQSLPNIAALIVDWPEWRKASVLICPLSVDG